MTTAKTTIKVKNVGPIASAEITLGKVNVFMGPQGCGKSTMAKIISHCEWVEKGVATSQSLDDYVNSPTRFVEGMESFHKMKGYFRADSYIHYKSNTLEITHKEGQSTLEWVDQLTYHRSKIAYIPAERNIVSLPEFADVPLGKTNLLTFFVDWRWSRKEYTKDKRLQIPSLDVEYYYVEGSDEDHISGMNRNQSYDILMSNASSGQQSITPIIATVDYLIKRRFVNMESPSNMEKLFKGQSYLVEETLFKPYFGEEYDHIVEQGKQNIFFDKYKEGDSKATKCFEDYRKLLGNLIVTQNSQFIIEEPEQNLYPKTQGELVYHLLAECLKEEDNRLTLTTHSPYILCAIDNCMIAHLVDGKMPSDETKDLRCWKGRINPVDVNLWQIGNDGVVVSVKDSETNLVGDDFLNKEMGTLLDEYYAMLNYYGE